MARKVGLSRGGPQDMRLLFCCEYYHPSRGGVQEVMRQLAERMVAWGHDVTVATTRLTERTSTVLNGVKIAEFGVSGNLVRGLEGGAEIDRYRRFLATFPADALMIKAAQQWTFDAAWPVLDQIRARKVFIPCGFSGLYLPEYRDYFRELPNILRRWDQLIFYAERYRDIDFAREHGITNFTILPNGASDIEFAVPKDPGFRARLGISDDATILLTVGTPINAKGHAAVAEAFARLETGGRPMALILNGQWPEPPPPAPAPPPLDSNSAPVTHSLAAQVTKHSVLIARLAGYVRRALDYLRREGTCAFLRRAAEALSYRSLDLLRRMLAPLGRLLRQVWYRVRLLVYRLRLHVWRGAHAGRQRVHGTHARSAARQSSDADPVSIEPSTPPPPKTIDDWIEAASRQPGKQVLKTHLSREDTVQAFLAADLFVFASIVEYSPLVLFEAAAAGTPFLTVPVGNSEEIVRWTGGGQVCPALKDAYGFTRVDPAVLATEIARLLSDPNLCRQLGIAGRDAWRTTYNWGSIARRYEAILAPPQGCDIDTGAHQRGCNG